MHEVFDVSRWALAGSIGAAVGSAALLLKRNRSPRSPRLILPLAVLVVSPAILAAIPSHPSYRWVLVPVLTYFAAALWRSSAPLDAALLPAVPTQWGTRIGAVLLPVTGALAALSGGWISLAIVLSGVVGAALGETLADLAHRYAQDMSKEHVRQAAALKEVQDSYSRTLRDATNKSVEEAEKLHREIGKRESDFHALAQQLKVAQIEAGKSALKLDGSMAETIALIGKEISSATTPDQNTVPIGKLAGRTRISVGALHEYLRVMETANLVRIERPLGSDYEFNEVIVLTEKGATKMTDTSSSGPVFHQHIYDRGTGQQNYASQIDTLAQQIVRSADGATAQVAELTDSVKVLIGALVTMTETGPTSDADKARELITTIEEVATAKPDASRRSRLREILQDVAGFASLAGKAAAPVLDAAKAVHDLLS